MPLNVIFGIILAKGFLIPLCIGGVLATLFLPVCKWLESKGISKFLAVSMCVISFLLAIALVFAVVVDQVASISQDFTILQARLLKITANIQDLLLDKVGISIDSQMKVIGSQKDYFNNLIVGTAGSVLSMLFQFGLILVYLFGLLYYRLHIKSFLLQLFTLNSKNLAETTLYKVSLVSQQYLLGLAKMIVLLWVMYGIGFSIIGIKNALFFKKAI